MNARRIDLDGHVALVTGAAAGIGQGIAHALAAAGARLAICDIQDKVIDVGEAISRATGQEVFATTADVRDADDVRRFVDTAAARFGGLDVVVANAGVWRPTDPLADDWTKAQAEWDLIVDTNLRGVFLTGRACIPLLAARAAQGHRNVHIVNIATDHICPPPGHATGGGTRMDIYDASKWGINGLTQSWAKRLAASGIRVNALCMDATDSEMVRYAAGAAATPEVIARWMQPAQIGALVLDLLAEGPDGRSGENIGIWMGHPVVLPPRREVLPSRHP
jgi:NAD(P)-dependent dehydrogenase (short-subunit alcohol dehydrogenase family)